MEYEDLILAQWRTFEKDLRPNVEFKPRMTIEESKGNSKRPGLQAIFDGKLESPSNANVEFKPRTTVEESEGNSKRPELQAIVDGKLESPSNAYLPATTY